MKNFLNSASVLASLALIYAAPIGLATTALLPTSAHAQTAPDGCTAVNGGVFNQTVGAGGSGTTITRRLTFNAGDTIMVTISGASNSLFEMTGVSILFSGETGSQSKSFTFTARTEVTISADIRAGAGAPASISATCTPAPQQAQPTAPAATDKIPVDQLTPADVSMAIAAAGDALDRGRHNTSASGLPSVIKQDEFTRLKALEAERRAIARVLATSEEKLNKKLRQMGLYGGLDDLQVSLALSQFFAEMLGDFGEQGDFHAAAPKLIERLVQIASNQPNTPFTEPAIRAAAISFPIEALKYGSNSRRFQAISEEQNLIDSRIERRIENNISVSSQGFTFSTQGQDIDALGGLQLWAKGSVSQLGGANGRAGQSGTLQFGIVGAPNSTTSVGLYIAARDGVVQMTAPATRVSERAFGLGVYGKFNLGADTQGGLSLYHERSQNNANVAGVTGSYTRTYSSIDADISRTYFVNRWFLTPSVRVGYASATQNSYTDSAGAVIPRRTDTYGSASASLGFLRNIKPTFGRNVVGMSVFGNVAATYSGANSLTLANGTSLTSGNASGAISLGTTLLYKNTGSVTMEIGTSGLGSRSNATTLRVNYAIEF